MDCRPRFLTANADTVSFWSCLDLSQGPLVMEVPTDSLGCVDDMWFPWVTDFGLPGAARGHGGAYLMVGPGYDGPLPEGEYYVRQSRTSRVLFVGRAFINENPGCDPAATADRVKAQMKIYPCLSGGIGSSIGAFVTGRGPLGAAETAASPRFVEHGSSYEHHPAQRLRPLRDARRSGPDGGARGARCRVGWPVRGDRHRQGREVRAR
jgi:hypothetical protein